MKLRQSVPKYFEEDIYYFNIGNHQQAYDFLGSHPRQEDSVEGVQFSVWAPNAHRVYVSGDFNDWQLTELYPQSGGVWSAFVPEARPGDHYKYGIDHGNGYIHYKIDPFAKRFEEPPSDASIVNELPDFQWQDNQWMKNRRKSNMYEEPLNIYEVHPTSWKQHEDGSYYDFDDLTKELIPYVKKMGYTHIEFMPIMDHPLDMSWGYQLTGYYAISARYGSMDQFMNFVNTAHQEGVGVMLDWVPGHYSRNDNALAYFDGTPTFEYSDQNRADNVQWGALNFDLGKNQVQSFLISNALYWLREFHIDGIRVDAVSNILYLDFDQGDWMPNKYGDNRNLEGIEFLKKLNTSVHNEFPQAIMMAEESTNFPKITHPVEEDGLGFNFKWNMGWMNDTLEFFEMDSLLRPDNLNLITFVFMYQYDEKFILPLSHDEVVHGKDSLLGKMPGDRYNQFANLRTLQGYMLAQPGKKLNFMGNELGQFLEWRFSEGLEWVDLEREFNTEYQRFIRAINQFALENKAMYELDHDPQGLQILDANNYNEAVLTFIRRSKTEEDFVIVVCNFTPVERTTYPMGVPYEGTYQVVLNSEDIEFGGTWEEPHPLLVSEEEGFNHQPYRVELTVPAMSVLYIKPYKIDTTATKGKETE